MVPWKRTYQHPTDDDHVESVNDMDWFDAPKPRRWHRCKPQTRGSFTAYGLVERCACGGVRMGGGGPWIERNSR